MEMVASGKAPQAKATKDEVFSVELQSQVGNLTMNYAIEWWWIKVVSLVEMISERDAKIEVLEKQRTASTNGEGRFGKFLKMSVH